MTEQTGVLRQHLHAVVLKELGLKLEALAFGIAIKFQKLVIVLEEVRNLIPAEALINTGQTCTEVEVHLAVGKHLPHLRLTGTVGEVVEDIHLIPTIAVLFHIFLKSGNCRSPTIELRDLCRIKCRAGEDERLRLHRIIVRFSLFRRIGLRAACTQRECRGQC